MKVNLLQMQSSQKFEDNLRVIEQAFHQQFQHRTPASTVQLALLPEAAWVFAQYHQQNRDLASNTDSITRLCSELAKQYALIIVAGTVPVPATNERCYSRCLVWGPQGQLLGHYDKMHLFDVDIRDRSGAYRESEHFAAGDQPSLIDCGSLTLGLTVCYDLRFPELFQHYKALGAHLITVPSAFTAKTGRAHWQPLLQARAIENQCFILAVGQWGQHDNGRTTWGHSMIIDPWGRILAEKAQGSGWLTSDIDVSQIDDIQRMMPIQQHKRFAQAKLKSPK
ncbi:carbon-nitrogen hydrolase family protein [Paraferrimonas haliotis]|uniref:Amidohydrolase n=1 Tax=Paraferrimonas haliotis TaxID=2013866 RepID=A0AA37TT45_9GAMM|nr:carbon-nitrogen hydrolase family protein [Paraferrimonas haliotis]GLS82360.1 amidohydrolase [Paraferrimonas haliotis]